MELPLFPLHSVLCPGVALPLHIFEERYRLMVGRCIDRGEPFGVVLIREGRDTGPLDGRIASVGSTAIISEVNRYPDGRLDIMTVGGRRFHITAIDRDHEPYLVGEVEILEEPLGDGAAARRLAQRVSKRFLVYLDLLQPALSQDDDDVSVEIEIELTSEPATEPDPAAPGSVEDEPDAAAAVSDEGLEVVVEAVPGEPGEASGEEAGFGQDPREQELSAAMEAASDAERHELLMAAARRLAVPDDPTALSYILGGLIQVELPNRQALLEAVDAETRLRQLDAVLSREIRLLGRRLKPLLVDPRLAQVRRN
jgi:Lon protease-like protein